MKDTNLDELEQEDFDTSAEISDNTDTDAGGINAFVQRSGKRIIIISIAVIVVVGLILLFRMNSQKNEADAAKALARVEAYYLQGYYNEALYAENLPFVRGEKVIGLIAIASEYSSANAGQRAALYAADALYMLGKYPEAKVYYEKAINSNLEEIKIGGIAGTAACNEKDGKIKEAADGYMKAANLMNDDGLRMRYLYFAGICNEKSGNSDEARKIYRSILDLNRYGEFNNLAKAGIVRLGEVID